MFDDRRISDLYRKFRLPIFKYVLRKVPNRHTAEEITQETFLKAFRFGHSYNGRHGVSTWLWTIARNTLLDWHRSNRAAKGAGDEGLAPLEAADRVASPLPDPETLLIEYAHRAELKRRTQRLTELQKRALILRLVDHLSYREIAHRLGLSLDATKCLIQRARAGVLREAMAY